MGISFNGDITSVMGKLNASKTSASSADTLASKLSNLENASDEELMDACKSFEAYLLERVLTQTKEAMVPKDEDEENEYLKMFGDKLYEGYAQTITDSGQLGIAQKLFEAMKRDYGKRIDPADLEGLSDDN